MDFACVIGRENDYRTYVQKNADGKILYYTLGDEERCIDAAPPFFSSLAGDGGLVRPRWDEMRLVWTEGATQDELNAFAEEHPQPEDEPAPTLESRVQVLEAETAAISAAIERGLSL